MLKIDLVQLLKLEFLNVRKWFKEVSNPSSIFTNKENISGVTTTITNEGSRPFAVDIQALLIKLFTIIQGEQPQE